MRFCCLLITYHLKRPVALYKGAEALFDYHSNSPARASFSYFVRRNKPRVTTEIAETSSDEGYKSERRYAASSQKLNVSMLRTILILVLLAWSTGNLADAKPIFIKVFAPNTGKI